MQYRRGRKKGETHWIGSALRQGEVKTIQHSDYTMWWFRDSLHIRWRHAPQQIAVPFAVCIFGGFGEIAFTSRHKQARRFATNRNISCNAKQFNAQIERLMFCKAIRHNATPFICILYHSTLRWAISLNAIPFVCTLYHSTLRWAIWVANSRVNSVTPFRSMILSC